MVNSNNNNNNITLIHKLLKSGLLCVVICSRNWVPGPGAKTHYPVPNLGNWYPFLSLITDVTKAMKPISSWMKMSNCLNEHFVPRPDYDRYYFHWQMYTRLSLQTNHGHFTWKNFVENIR